MYDPHYMPASLFHKIAHPTTQLATYIICREGMPKTNQGTPGKQMADTPRRTLTKTTKSRPPSQQPQPTRGSAHTQLAATQPQTPRLSPTTTPNTKLQQADPHHLRSACTPANNQPHSTKTASTFTTTLLTIQFIVDKVTRCYHCPWFEAEPNDILCVHCRIIIDSSDEYTLTGMRFVPPIKPTYSWQQLDPKSLDQRVYVLTNKKGPYTMPVPF